MTFEQAQVLTQSASDLMALGKRLEIIADSLNALGEPEAHYQPLVESTGHIGEAMKAVFRSLESAHADGGGPFDAT